LPQHIILNLRRDACALLRGDMLRHFVDKLRRRFGV
jgi:hypothetical protein